MNQNLVLNLSLHPLTTSATSMSTASKTHCGMMVIHFVAYSRGIPGEFPGNGELPLICRGTRSPNGSRDSIVPGGTIQSHQNIAGERFQHTPTRYVNHTADFHYYSTVHRNNNKEHVKCSPYHMQFQPTAFTQ